MNSRESVDNSEYLVCMAMDFLTMASDEVYGKM
jgi:hypothetical protein